MKSEGRFQRMGWFSSSYEFKFGNIRAAVVRRKVGGKDALHIAFFRQFTDENGKKQESMEFTPEDLPELEALASDLYRALKKG